MEASAKTWNIYTGILDEKKFLVTKEDYATSDSNILDLSTLTQTYTIGGSGSTDTSCEGTTAKPCKSLSKIKTLATNVKY